MSVSVKRKTFSKSKSSSKSRKKLNKSRKIFQNGGEGEIENMLSILNDQFDNVKKSKINNTTTITFDEDEYEYKLQYYKIKIINNDNIINIDFYNILDTPTVQNDIFLTLNIKKNTETKKYETFNISNFNNDNKLTKLTLKNEKFITIIRLFIKHFTNSKTLLNKEELIKLLETQINYNEDIGISNDFLYKKDDKVDKLEQTINLVYLALDKTKLKGLFPDHIMWEFDGILFQNKSIMEKVNTEFTNKKINFDILHDGIKYIFNLDKKEYTYTLKDYEYKHKIYQYTILEYIKKWLVKINDDEYLNSRTDLVLWYDSILVDNSHIEKTKKDFYDLNKEISENAEMSKSKKKKSFIYLRDIRKLKTFIAINAKNEFLFNTTDIDGESINLPIYFRVDLARLIVAYDELQYNKKYANHEYNGLKYFMYVDADIIPQSLIYFFDKKILLDMTGLIVAKQNNRMENSFFILGSDNEIVKKSMLDGKKEKDHLDVLFDKNTYNKNEENCCISDVIRLSIIDAEEAISGTCKQWKNKTINEIKKRINEAFNRYKTLHKNAQINACINSLEQTIFKYFVTMKLHINIEEDTKILQHYVKNNNKKTKKYFFNKNITNIAPNTQFNM